MMRYPYQIALSAFRNRKPKTKSQTMMSHTLPIPMQTSLSIRMAGYPFGTVSTVGANPAESLRETLKMAGDLHDAAAQRMPVKVGKLDRLSIVGDVAEALFLIQRDADAIAAALALGCRGAGESRFALERQGTLSGCGIVLEIKATRGQIENKG